MSYFITDNTTPRSKAGRTDVPLETSQCLELRPLAPEGTAADLSCRVETDFGPLESQREQWDQAVIRFQGGLYMSFDWSRTWWQFYGVGRALRIFIFHQGDTLVGILPTYIDTMGVWPLRLKVGRLVGASFPSRIVHPPIDPAWLAPALEHVVSHLLAKDQCDVLALGLFSKADSALSGWAQACEALPGVAVAPAVLEAGVHTLFHLPPTYDEYFQSLPAKERKIRRKRLSDLEEDHAVRVEVVKEPACASVELEAFIEQHTTQWTAEGRPGHFHAWPMALEFHRTLVRLMGDRGRVRFIKLYAGEQVAANQYTYVFGQSLFAELPARITGGGWERYSLGCTSQLKLIEAAIAEGLTCLDSGPGHYDYKVWLNGTELGAVKVRLVARRFWSRLAMAVAAQAGRMLGILYDKIWYQRIAPRLSAHCRSRKSLFVLRLDL